MLFSFSFSERFSIWQIGFVFHSETWKHEHLRSFEDECWTSQRTTFGSIGRSTTRTHAQVQIKLSFFFCSIRACYTCYTSSCMAKHLYFTIRKSVVSNLREGPELRTHYWWDWEEKKKPSTWRDSNPQPEEFSSAGVCSSAVLQMLPQIELSWRFYKFALLTHTLPLYKPVNTPSRSTFTQ